MFYNFPCVAIVLILLDLFLETVFIYLFLCWFHWLCVCVGGEKLFSSCCWQIEMQYIFVYSSYMQPLSWTHSFWKFVCRCFQFSCTQSYQLGMVNVLFLLFIFRFTQLAPVKCQQNGSVGILVLDFKGNASNISPLKCFYVLLWEDRFSLFFFKA